MPKLDNLSKAIAALSTSVIGVAGAVLVMTAEGKENAAYRDPVGIVTICYGHTGPDVKMGMVKTDAECDELFRQDVIKHQHVITPGDPRNCIGNRVLNLNQKDAITSFIFNVGEPKFCKSTLAKRITSGDDAAVPKELNKWINAGGKPLKGLVTRRAKEGKLYASLEAWEPYENRDNPVKLMVTYK